MSGKANIRQKAEFLKLVELTPIERGLNNLPVSPQEMADHIGVHVATIYGWQKEYKEWGEITIPKTDEEEREELIIHLYQESLQPNCPANKIELMGRMRGWIKNEPQEIKLVISADERARRNLEAERELREAGYRMDEVQEEPTLLPEKLRLDSGQSPSSDS